MHCPTDLDYSNSEQKRRKPFEILISKATLDSLSCSVLVNGLDTEMNRLQSGAKKHSKVLTEDLLWAKRLARKCQTPKMLLDTVVFYSGLYFTLCSGRVHRLMGHSPCQVEVIEKPGE